MSALAPESDSFFYIIKPSLFLVPHPESEGKLLSLLLKEEPDYC